jgi:arabinan endo-1,5-alpha-L-arabinosidase
LFVDSDEKWYLVFGSFWSGIKMVEVEAKTGKPREAAEIQPMASRPKHRTHAIEAPFVIQHGDFYYLFVSWDRCCDGADSDYKVMVGRAPRVNGPYIDASGRRLLEGGGTLVLQGDERWRGPGHNSILSTDQGQWLVHHTYDVRNLRAQRVLQIRPLTWSEDGWPEVGKPIFEPAPRPVRSILKR